MNELLNGPQEKLGRVYIGTSHTYSTGNHFEVLGKIYLGELRTYRKNANHLVSPRQIKHFPVDMDNIEILPHLGHLFKNFTSNDDRTDLFRQIIKAYVQSDFPVNFNRNGKRETSVGKKIEIEIMKRNILEIRCLKW